jgi:hypothetical protein
VDATAFQKDLVTDVVHKNSSAIPQKYDIIIIGAGSWSQYSM